MKVKRLCSFVLTLLIALSILAIPTASSADYVQAADAQTSPYLSKTDAVLDFLTTIQAAPVQPDLAATSQVIRSALQTQHVGVSIRFDHELSEIESTDLEKEGLVFVRIDGAIAHSGTIYGADVPVEYLSKLEERADVVRIESAWKPFLKETLDVSVPEINADDVWQLVDGGGNNVTGEGMIIADFDTGIDVFHPDFWKADGGSYSWIDTNSNGSFDSGIDAVDLDGDSSAGTSETLRFFDAEGAAGNNDGIYQADEDWLYNDANNNTIRDYGIADGFTEADPTYGELIFITDDTNGNNMLDIGEDVIALGTSKVLATLNSGGTARTRGTDLISTDADTNGHGTGVCGIVNAGDIGNRKYVGVAPSAELLVVDRYNNDYTVYIPWARTNGADVMLYEFGGWVQHFLDGSSNLEQAIDTEAAGGIAQVVPAGNLGNKDKHAQDDVPAGGSTNFTFNVPGLAPSIEWVYITALWRHTGNNLAFNLTLPGMIVIVVNLPATPPASWTTTTVDGHTIWYRREDSSRGTAKYDIIIEKHPAVGFGGWELQVTNTGGSAEHVDMYIADDQTAWSGGAVWTAFQSNENTVTYPATADSAITVASYSTRGWGGVAAGDLSTFSPEGPRIDGQPIVDIAAPGNYDIASTASKDIDADGNGIPDYTIGSYRWFSGTSAAGPHVAAACALILQYDPTLSHADVKTRLQQSARTDAFTGVTPNADWGFGKLDILGAINPPPEAEKHWSYTDVCFALDNDGDGLVDEDPVDFEEVTLPDGTVIQVPIDNDGDGLYNEDPAECDEYSLGTALPMTDPFMGLDTYQLKAVVKKNGKVASFNPGQFYAVSTVEVLLDLDELVINEYYWAITEGSGLGKLNPNPLEKNAGGGCVVVVKMMDLDADGIAETPVQILDAMDEEVVVQSDMATVTLENVTAGTYMVYVKFAPGLKGEPYQQWWATNTNEAIGTVAGFSRSDSAQAAITVVEKM
jgi:subtilisin family serine protease